MSEKRIIEQLPSEELYNDDWFIKDSVLNGTKKISQAKLKELIVGDVKGVVELTQAEYDALPSSKLTDGILYAIKDSEDIIGCLTRDIASSSDDWKDNVQYHRNDIVMKDYKLYRAAAVAPTMGTWVDNQWIEISLYSMIYTLNRWWMIAEEFLATPEGSEVSKPYYKGDLVWYSPITGIRNLYMCKEDMPDGAAEFDDEKWLDLGNTAVISALSSHIQNQFDTLMLNASNVVYDNSESGLDGNRVQEAIDEVVELIEEAGQIDDVQVKTTGDYESVVANKVAKIDLSNMLIEKSVPNLPQSVATFNDGSDLPLKSLTASIVPVQDLHGYDSPWVGGAGKNKFDIDATHTTGTGTYIYEVYVKPNTPYTLSSNCPSSSPANLYFNGGSSETNGVGMGSPKTFNSGEDGKFTIYVRSLASGTAIDLYSAVKNGQYYIQLEEGLTATSFAPYSNICPISGWTEEVITRTGKNLATRQSLTSSGNGGLDANIRIGNAIVGTQYTLSVDSLETNAKNIRVYIGSTETTSVSTGNWMANNRNSVTFTANISGEIGLGTNRETFSNSTKVLDNIQLEIGDEATTYEPYLGTTTTIPFTDSQGQSVEVFGGSVDVVNGGEQQRTLASVDMGTLAWAGTTNNRFVAYLNDVISASGDFVDFMCEMFTPRASIENGSIWINNKKIYVVDTTHSTTTDFTNFVNGKKIVYPLATPTTFYTQPTSIKSLDGDNNVFAITGDVTKLEYIANATDVIANLEARVTALENQ